MEAIIAIGLVVLVVGFMILSYISFRKK